MRSRAASSRRSARRSWRRRHTSSSAIDSTVMCSSSMPSLSRPISARPSARKQVVRSSVKPANCRNGRSRSTFLADLPTSSPSSRARGVGKRLTDDVELAGRQLQDDLVDRAAVLPDHQHVFAVLLERDDDDRTGVADEVTLEGEASGIRERAGYELEKESPNRSRSAMKRNEFGLSQRRHFRERTGAGCDHGRARAPLRQAP